MAVNFGQLKTRILKEARKDSTDFGTAAGEAIVSAIQFYDYKPMWFNKKAASPALVLLQSTNAVDLPSDFKAKVSLRILRGTRYYGRGTGFNEITENRLWEEANDTQSGAPSQYAFFGTQILFDRTADADYTLSLHYVYGDASYPSSDSSTSMWFEDYCVNAVRDKALEYFYRDALKDSAKGAEYEVIARTHWANLVTQNNMRSSPEID